jgi:hypothetical protein
MTEECGKSDPAKPISLRGGSARSRISGANLCRSAGQLPRQMTAQPEPFPQNRASSEKPQCVIPIMETIQYESEWMCGISWTVIFAIVGKSQFMLQ